ncbi:hypothetical protein ABZ552_32855 [Nocardia sp. NPDC019219]|uniref:hypothetical protein n=1 Tax=Nocardia sp. NPDC019219 TaxID=3154590 RepID=UPI003408A4A9
MAYDRINRTNIQALYRYMPGQPYNWGMNKPSVIGLTPRQTTSLDLPERWVVPQLRRLIEPFSANTNGGTTTSLDVIDREQFILVKAEDLQAERFPNTFMCGTCNSFRTAPVGQRPPTCSRGHGEMRQFAWTEVHECGHIRGIVPPRCDKCRRTTMRLLNTTSFNTSEWYWKCECGERSSRPVTNWCATCRNSRVELKRIPQSPLHYPQQITVLNPPSRKDFAALAHGQVHRAAVAQCLGQLPLGIEGLRIASGGDPGGDATDKVREMAATMGLGPGDPLYDQLLERASEKHGSAPAWSEAVDALGRSPEAVDELGEECLQLTLARDTKDALTTSQLREIAEGLPLEPDYAKYPDWYRLYGLSEVTLLRKLPIAYLVAGYTRLSPKAQLVNKYRTIKPSFRFFEGRDSKFPIYGVKTQTEGLLFELNRLRVIEWLTASGVIDDPGVSTNDEAQRWFLERLDPVTNPFAAPNDLVSKAVLGLVHSMSHRVMKALAARCGLNVDSLAEYLFPANCAFLIYSNTRTEFTLGGLEHVYRFSLIDALRELDAESRCIFDPPCRETFGGACAACLHVSEVACARFNTVLDRNLLFGSLSQKGGHLEQDNSGYEDIRWQAYWNH